MNSRSGSWVRRSRTVDGVSGPSSQDSVTRHHSIPAQALVPTIQEASSAASPSSYVVDTVMRVGGLVVGVPLEHYKGKTFKDVVKSDPSGVDPSDWRTMYEKWNTREEQDIAERNRQNRAHQNMTYRQGRTSIYQLRDDFVKTHQREPNCMEIFKMERCKDLPDGTQRWVDDESSSRFERMTQMTTPALQSDDVIPVSAEDAFIVIMGRDRSGRVRCVGKAETLDSWYGRGEGSSTSDGYHTQVQQLQH
ncbi:hypothetical protein Taro_016570 [Colocasia esculenta]|uniref:Uncharacterized protein n=1 Tax=Colocasia esculenta TaxID=4460 RepID=A0A843UP52_COLES|nr:hypothetical protein [Colocasia esculenta]